MARFNRGTVGIALFGAVAACGGRLSPDISSSGASSGGLTSASGVPPIGGSGVTAGSSGPLTSGAVKAGSSGPFRGAIPNQIIDKIDLLFDVDNSASMGDKQQYLAQAIPDLVDRLVNPNCIDPATLAIVGQSQVGQGCPAGSRPEFPAVKDMHIGIVSSSLGPRLSESDPTHVTGLCNDPQQAQAPFGSLNAHMDDHAHLLSRSLTGVAPDLVEGAVADAASGFLYWYPEVANGMGADGPPAGPATPLQNAGITGAAGTLEGDFGSLVAGVGVFGCGIESQMESWYRFLVQPDPYETLALDMTQTVSGQHPAQWVGVDSTIIQERHDFLRPDSLVAVVVLSDENDSEIDVRSLGGLGYFFMRTGFAPPHGTSACATNPLSASCVSCAPGSTDPACMAPGGGVAVYSAVNDWGYDPNLRHVHMRQKYGIDPQYPIERYFYGLTSPVVPDRAGEYPAGATDYSGFGQNMRCTNPLYAASLPTEEDLSATIATATPVLGADAKALCNLPAGTRTSDKIFFVHIGGVPHQLLHFKPGDPVASTLTSADWVKILGTDPEHYNFNGIDPHMVESVPPRLPGQAEALANPPTFDSSGTNPLAPTSAPSNTDPVSGREWITDLPLGGHRLEEDIQYACIFPLATPRDCTQAINGYACDCPATPTLTHDQTPPVCSDTLSTMQVAAKAYPTVRELQVAKMMGPQGIVASICPIDTTDNAAGNDPLYGYRPAMSALVDRLKVALTNACLPEKLTVTSNGAVSCSLLVTLPGQGSCTNPTCPAGLGLAVPTKSVLDTFCANAEANYEGEKGAPPDPALQSVCQLTQLVDGQANAADFDANGSCDISADKGWCYVEGAGANGCAQAIVFAQSSPPAGSVTSLECSQ
jgi:hypothetical protein